MQLVRLLIFRSPNSGVQLRLRGETEIKISISLSHTAIRSINFKIVHVFNFIFSSQISEVENLNHRIRLVIQASASLGTENQIDDANSRVQRRNEEGDILQIRFHWQPYLRFDGSFIVSTQVW